MKERKRRIAKIQDAVAGAASIGHLRVRCAGSCEGDCADVGTICISGVTRVTKRNKPDGHYLVPAGDSCLRFSLSANGVAENVPTDQIELRRLVQAEMSHEMNILSSLEADGADVDDIHDDSHVAELVGDISAPVRMECAGSSESDVFYVSGMLILPVSHGALWTDKGLNASFLPNRSIRAVGSDIQGKCSILFGVPTTVSSNIKGAVSESAFVISVKNPDNREVGQVTLKTVEPQKQILFTANQNDLARGGVICAASGHVAICWMEGSMRSKCRLRLKLPPCYQQKEDESKRSDSSGCIMVYGMFQVGSINFDSDKQYGAYLPVSEYSTVRCNKTLAGRIAASSPEGEPVVFSHEVCVKKGAGFNDVFRNMLFAPEHCLDTMDESERDGFCPGGLSDIRLSRLKDRTTEGGCSFSV